MEITIDFEEDLENKDKDMVTWTNMHGRLEIGVDLYIEIPIEYYDRMKKMRKEFVIDGAVYADEEDVCNCDFIVNKGEGFWERIITVANKRNYMPEPEVGEMEKALGQMEKIQAHAKYVRYCVGDDAEEAIKNSRVPGSEFV